MKMKDWTWLHRRLTLCNLWQTTKRVVPLCSQCSFNASYKRASVAKSMDAVNSSTRSKRQLPRNNARPKETNCFWPAERDSVAGEISSRTVEEGRASPLFLDSLIEISSICESKSSLKAKFRSFSPKGKLPLMLPARRHCCKTAISCS